MIRTVIMVSSVVSLLVCTAMHALLWTPAQAHTPAANQSNCAGAGRACYGSTFKGTVFHGTGNAASRAFIQDTADYFCFDGTACNRWLRYDGATLTLGDSGAALNITRGSGSNAIQLSTNGARIDLGTGANDHLRSNGTWIRTDDDFQAGTFRSGSGIFLAESAVTSELRGQIADSATAVGIQLDNSIALTTNGAKIVSIRSADTEHAYFSKDGALRLNATNTLSVARPACDSSTRGLLWFVENSGSDDVLSLCRRDAGSSYAWVTL